MVLLGVSPHILLKCWNVFVNGRGERTQHSHTRLPEDIDWGLIARLTSVSVHSGPWSGSRSYFRGRIRAEMTHNHPEPGSYAHKAPKIHMTDAFQETMPNMMTFAIKLSEREMRLPLLHSKQWTALQVKGADSVGRISSIGRIEFKRSWAQRLLGNDEAGSCVCWSVMQIDGAAAGLELRCAWVQACLEGMLCAFLRQVSRHAGQGSMWII